MKKITLLADLQIVLGIGLVAVWLFFNMGEYRVQEKAIGKI